MLEELEELVERTIRHLATARQAGHAIDVPSLVANLYAFQERYDAADTRERLFDLLVEEGYAYRLALSDHPAGGEALDRLVSDRAFDGIVPLDPAKPLDPVHNPIGGLYVAP